MEKKELQYKSREELESELQELRYQLTEANDTIEAIRTGQVDAIVIQGEEGHQLYTLKSADHTYRLFIEKMNEGAVTLSRDGMILYSNSKFADLTGLPLYSLTGKYFESFIAEESRTDYQSYFLNSWKEDVKGEALLSGENKLIPVQLSLTTLELEEGISLSIIITDLTALKATQHELKSNVEKLGEINQALEASNHDLQQFASVASHDLQEPLRKIQIFSNFLKQDNEQMAPSGKLFLDKIIDSAARMKTLIIDILNYSRLSTNDHQNECVDLNELAHELEIDFELVIKEKNAHIIIGQLPCVDGVKGQIRQVFQNIINNALKFSRPGIDPVIEISSVFLSERSFDSKEVSEGPYCCIRISDNGIGFDPKYVNNIFALFERLNSKDKYEGTGIGLAIAKKVIDKHNGLITARSKPGEGSEFKIILQVSSTQP
jgi:PAS domain S-box-containing protein